MIDNQINYKNYYFSFLIIIIVNFINFYISAINPDINRILKVIIGSHIFFSIFFITYKFNLVNFFSKGKNNLFLIIIFYCFFQFLRPPAENYNLIIGNYWFSKFGGLNYDSLFLIPLFYLWSNYKDSIYWFEKFSLLSVKIGILLVPFCYFFKLPFFYTAFFPIYYLLAGYNYSNFKRKLWIISSFILGNYIFFIDSYRSGIIRSLIILALIILVKLNFKNINKKIIYFFVIIPFLTLISTFYFNFDIFNFILNRLNFIDPSYLINTRTFIFEEIINHFNLKGNLIIGDGGFGNYYSNYFDIWRNISLFEGGDFYFRNNSEVGLLGIMLKGGLILLILIFLLVIKCININFKFSKNRYTQMLTLIVASYFMFLTVENTFKFDLINITFWIMLSIASNIKLNSLSENEIKNIFNK